MANSDLGFVSACNGDAFLAADFHCFAYIFFFTNSSDSIGRFARYFGDGLKFPDDCPFNSFVYVTRKISETKASEEGDQDGISMSGDRLGELRQIHLSFALQTDSVDRSDRSWYFK